VVGAHEGEDRVRVLDDPDAGAAIEGLERVVLGIVRIGADGLVRQSGRHDISSIADADVR